MFFFKFCGTDFKKFIDQNAISVTRFWVINLVTDSDSEDVPMSYFFLFTEKGSFAPLFVQRRIRFQIKQRGLISAGGGMNWGESGWKAAQHMWTNYNNGRTNTCHSMDPVVFSRPNKIKKKGESSNRLMASTYGEHR